MEDQTVGIVGAGTMGSQIAALAAICGHNVLIYDIVVDSSKIEKQIARTQRFLKRADSMQPHLGKPAGSWRLVENMQDLADANIIMECVAEDLHIKSEVLKKLSDLAGTETILGTNTSSMPLDELAACVTDNCRFLGVHFFNPIHAVPLVEICPLPGTAPGTLDRMSVFLESLGRLVVHVPNSPGFVVNRLLFLMIASAARMLDEGGISAKDVDTAMKAGTNMPMGPIELADLIGLDICASILESLYAQTDEQAYRPPHCILECVENKNLGRKSGSGLYEWERKTCAIP